jgi:hypothetical protein
MPAPFSALAKLADHGVQLFVGNVGHLAVVAFKDDGFFVFSGCAEVAVQAVVRSVELTVGKPFVKRGAGLVQRLGERLLPAQVFTRQTGPKPLEIFLGFRAQRLVSRHA